MSATETFGRVYVWWFRLLRENDASPMARDVLVVLASHANKKTGQCWPSVATIASTLGVSQKAVKSALSDLKVLGLVRSTTRNRRAGESNLYHLAVHGERFHVTNVV